MPNSFARKPGDPPPTPTRNFSHSNRQRASSLSPEHHQVNHPMSRNDSRFMLPVLPSRAFSRSASNVSLQTEKDRRADFDFSYGSPHRPAISHTAFSTYSIPDLNATALPQMPLREAPPVLQIPQEYSDSVTPVLVPINPPSPRCSIRRPPLSPMKGAKSGKLNRWGRWSMRVRAAFKVRGYAKPPAPVPAPVVDIGDPSGFQHNITQGIDGLRASDGLFVPPAPNTPSSGSTGGTSTIVGRGHGGGDQGQMQSTTTVGEADRTGIGTGGGGTYAGLGHQDADGTAVSDDGDSEWEDEASQILRAWEADQQRRHASVRRS